MSFDKEIQAYKRYGTYEYKFDKVGNLYFNSTSPDISRQYLSCVLINFGYKLEKIKELYNIEFEEFIPTNVSSENTSSVNIDLFGQVVEENESLKQQLDVVLSQSENVSININDLATKQVILELRKQLGEGRVDSDFSNDFPYSPIRKE